MQHGLKDLVRYILRTTAIVERRTQVRVETVGVLLVQHPCEIALATFNALDDLACFGIGSRVLVGIIRLMRTADARYPDHLSRVSLWRSSHPRPFVLGDGLQMRS